LFFSRYIKAHHISHAALVIASVAAALVFFVVGAAIRLLVGPVSLGPFGNTLSNAIAQALPGISVRYDQAAIEWSRDEDKINLVILGARVFDEEGRIIAQAPKADIDLAAAPLLFEGKAVVRRITLVGVELTLVRTATGGLRLGVERDKNQHDILSRISDAISLRNDQKSSLQAFAVRHARLAYYDEPTGAFLVAPDANFRIATVDEKLSASLDAALEISGHPARVTGEFTLPPNKGPVKGVVALKGLDLHALGANGKAFSSIKGVGLTVDMSASFTFQGVHLLSADFGVGARGTLEVSGLPRGLVKLKDAEIVGRYDGTTGRVLIDDGTIDAEGAAAHLTAQADLVRDQNKAFSQVLFVTTIDKIALNLPGVLVGPVSLRTIAFRGRYLFATKDIVLDHLDVAGAPLSLQAAAKVTLVPGESPAVEAKGQLSALGIRDLLRYWPLSVGAGARFWIDKNMPAGALGPVTFEAHMPAGVLDQPALPDGALKVTIPLSGVDANYISGLTHLTQARGTATLTGNAFSADIASARIGALTVSQGHAVIPNLSAPASPGDFSARVSGAMPDILNLIDMKPLNYPTRFGIDKTQTKGAGNIDLSIHLPLRKNLNVDEVGISIKAAVTDFSILLGEHTRLSDGSINFLIDNTKLNATGVASLADSKLTFDWNEDFRTKNPVTTRIAVKGTLGDGAREALNFRSSDFLRGTVPISAALTGHRASLLNADMTMDIAPAVLSLDLIGLNKPAGFPATAHVTATFGPESSIKAETMTISGPGVALSGNVAFDKEGHLTQVSFPNVHFGAANDFSFNLTKSAAGANIVVKGHSLDGSHLGGHGGGGDMNLEGPFHVSARLDRLMLRENVAVAPFALDVSGVGDRPASLSLSGSLSKTATISGAIAPADGGRKLTLSTNDAGLFVKGLYGFGSLKGGRIDFSATLPGKIGEPENNNAPDYLGKITVRDFKVLNQPFLTRLFTAGSLGGLSNLMQGQGIAVDKLEVPFSSRGGVVSVHDVKATGPAIGLTADGYIDRPKNTIALKGTMVPLFGINSVLGAIPVLGNVLVSKPGEGVFGMTYSIKGNADQPDLSINPLSVLTPGIFRRIFEGKMPTAAQAPSNQAPPSAPVPAPPPPQ